MGEDSKSGKRYEIVVFKINRNNEGAIKQLYALEDYFKKRGDDYSIQHAAYGSPSKALKKVLAWYLDSNSLAHPYKTLYEINKMFIERKLVKSRDISDMGVQADVEGLSAILSKFFGAQPKKSEDIDDPEE